MPKRIFEKDKCQNVQKLIDWLLSVKTSTGWVVDTLNRITFAELKASSSNMVLSHGMVMRVLSEMADRGKSSIDDFESIFAELISSDATKSHQERWTFLIPFAIDFGLRIKHLPRLCILGCNFQFMTFRSAIRLVDRKYRTVMMEPDLLIFQTGLQVKKMPSTYISVASSGRTWESAWENVTLAFDTLRGLLELTLGMGTWQEVFGGVKPLRRVSPPAFMMCCCEGHEPEFVPFITEERELGDVYPITAKQFVAMRRNARMFRFIPQQDTTLFLIAKCLRLYAQALDTHLPHLRFLAFWQLAEAIAHSETIGGDPQKVAARIAWHGDSLGFKGSGYRETLGALAKTRNEIVHRGYQQAEQDDINILKLACEVALNWLIKERKALPTMMHLEKFYQLRLVNDKEQEAIKASLVYMNRTKARGK